MATTNYNPPIDQLLTTGDVRQLTEDINYLDRYQFDATHIPELIRLMNDDQLNSDETEIPEVWGPLHAWRALGQLDPQLAIDAMFERLLAHPYEDWLHEDLVELIGRTGESALPKIVQLFLEHRSDDSPILTLISSVGEIGKQHPSARKSCVDILTRWLKQSDENAPDANGCLVAELLDLNAVESIGVIEAAYYLDRVDPMICGKIEDVYIDLGLKEGPPPLTDEEENLRIAARFHALQHASPDELSELFPMFSPKKENPKQKPRKKFGKKHKPKR